MGTVINIYGDVHVNHISITRGNSIGKAIIDSLKESISDKDENKNDKEYSPERIPKTKNDTPCYDFYGRWETESQRDAWHRFYRANS